MELHYPHNKIQIGVQTPSQANFLFLLVAPTVPWLHSCGKHHLLCAEGPPLPIEISQCLVAMASAPWHQSTLLFLFLRPLGNNNLSRMGLILPSSFPGIPGRGDFCLCCAYVVMRMHRLWVQPSVVPTLDQLSNHMELSLIAGLT